MKKKEMVPLTDKENKSYEKQKVSYIRKQKFSTGENDKSAFKLYHENKYITFSVPISEELDNVGIITYRLKFIDSFRFMSTLLSSLVDNLSEKLHTDKCKDCKSVLDYMSVKDNQLIFQCLERKKIIRKTSIKNQLKDLQIYLNLVIETLINLFCY